MTQLSFVIGELQIPAERSLLPVGGLHEASDLPPKYFKVGAKVRLPQYPVEMVRALIFVWPFAGLRMGEIRRLRAGCIRWNSEALGSLHGYGIARRTITSAAVASAISLFGLILVSMGIYSMISYIVVLRTREIGVRMAVGAQKRDILIQVIRESMRPVVVGLVVGMFFAAGGSLLLRRVLYGVSTIDAVSFAGASLFFLVIALFASCPPAWRAMRVDPIVALRYE